jgi:hypothetical protein
MTAGLGLAGSTGRGRQEAVTGVLVTNNLDRREVVVLQNSGVVAAVSQILGQRGDRRGSGTDQLADWMRDQTLP